jgi:hypothetical protein
LKMEGHEQIGHGSRGVNHHLYATLDHHLCIILPRQWDRGTGAVLNGFLVLEVKVAHQPRRELRRELLKMPGITKVKEQRSGKRENEGGRGGGGWGVERGREGAREGGREGDRAGGREGGGE